jgi:hypothetical protein
MGMWIASVAAATAAVGADLFSAETWARSPRNRVLNGLALKGSAAAGDTEVELFIDEVRVGNFFNTNTGFPNIDDLFALDRLGVPAGAQLRCLVRDAATTNPIHAAPSLEDIQ